MKLVTTVVIAVLTGVGLGYATTVAEFGLSADSPVLDRPSLPTRQGGKAVVTDPVHDFGTMLLYGEGEHRFVIQNQGTADLTIEKKKTSCKCTISELSRTVIPPGQSAEITVSWKASVSWRKKKFVQTARIGTNDPANPEIVLRVQGTLLPEYRFTQPALRFDPVTQHDTRTAETRLYFYTHPAVEILKIAGQQSDAKPYLEIDFRPLNADQLQEEQADGNAPGQTAKCGYAITAKLKPGLKPKRYFHAVTFSTEPKMQQTMRLPIKIVVQPDIYVDGLGASFNAKTKLLDIGTLEQGQEYSKKMYVVLVGEQRHGDEFEVQEVVPQQLQVTIGQPEDLPNGTVRRPLHVRIPATATPLSLLGGNDGSLGHVVLATTHPHTPAYRFDVRVAVKAAENDQATTGETTGGDTNTEEATNAQTEQATDQPSGANGK